MEMVSSVSCFIKSHSLHAWKSGTVCDPSAQKNNLHCSLFYYICHNY